MKDGEPSSLINEVEGWLASIRKQSQEAKPSSNIVEAKKHSPNRRRKEYFAMFVVGGMLLNTAASLGFIGTGIISSNTALMLTGVDLIQGFYLWVPASFASDYLLRRKD